MKLQSLNLALQIITALLSIHYLFFKDKSRFTIILALFLSLIAIIESIGAFMLYIINVSTLKLHYVNILFLFTIIYVMYLFLIRNKNKRRVMSILHIVFIITWCLLYKNLNLSYLMILGSFNTSIFLFFYLNKLLASQRIINYKKILPFWVTVGFFTFYLPSVPFFILFNYLNNRSLFTIFIILSMIMNIIILYGLLCSSKEEKY